VQLFARQADAFIWESFPGAGPTLAPRLCSAFGSERWEVRYLAEVRAVSMVTRAALLPAEAGHPRAREREFVLRPLAELDPDLEIRGTSVAGWLARLDPQGVEPTGVPLM